MKRIEMGRKGKEAEGKAGRRRLCSQYVSKLELSIRLCINFDSNLAVVVHTNCE